MNRIYLEWSSKRKHNVGSICVNYCAVLFCTLKGNQIILPLYEKGISLLNFKFRQHTACSHKPFGESMFLKKIIIIIKVNPLFAFYSLFYWLPMTTRLGILTYYKFHWANKQVFLLRRIVQLSFLLSKNMMNPSSWKTTGGKSEGDTRLSREEQKLRISIETELCFNNLVQRSSYTMVLYGHGFVLTCWTRVSNRSKSQVVKLLCL